MLKEFEVRNAIPYVRSSLEAGSTLAQHLVRLPLEKGRVVTHLPAETSPEAVEQFETGHIASRRETRRHLTSFIETYLNGYEERYGVFETFARLGDRGFDPLEEQFWSYQLEVYDFVSSRDCGSDLIYRTVHSLARPYPFVGALTSLPKGQLHMPIGHELAISEIEMLASRTEHILIGAYDDEGTVIWSRLS